MPMASYAVSLPEGITPLNSAAVPIPILASAIRCLAPGQATSPVTAFSSIFTRSFIFTLKCVFNFPSILAVPCSTVIRYICVSVGCIQIHLSSSAGRSHACSLLIRIRLIFNPQHIGPDTLLKYFLQRKLGKMEQGSEGTLPSEVCF